MKKSLVFFAIILAVLLGSTFVSAQKATIWGVGIGGKATYRIESTVVLTSSNETLLPSTILNNQTSIIMEIVQQANDGYRYKLVSKTNITYGLVTFKQFSTPEGSMVIPVGDFPFVLPLAYGASEDFLKDFGESWRLMNKMSFIFGNETKVTANSTLDGNGLTLLLKMLVYNLTISDITNTLSFVTLPSLGLDRDINMSVANIDAFVFYAKKTGLLQRTTVELNGTANIYVNDTDTNEILLVPQNTVIVNSTILLVDFLNPGNVETRESLPFSFLSFFFGLLVISPIYLKIKKRNKFS